MSRRARARAGAISAKRIAFTPDPESAEDDDGAAFDLHDDDHKAWAWAQAVSAAVGSNATVKSGSDTLTSERAQLT